MVVDIDEPTQVVANIGSTDETCFESCDGTVTWSASGGTGPYVFNFDGVVVASSPITDLCAGLYGYNITDANGCNTDGSVTINPAEQIIPGALSVTDDGCTDECDGTISISSNTGVNYILSNGASSVSGQFSNICSGAYDITILDANGCTETVSAVVGDAEQATAEFGYTPGYVSQLESEVQLINTSFNADSYIWEITGPNGYYDVYDYDISSYEFPTEEGGYKVCLIAISSSGCQDTTCAPIVVQEEFSIFIPNTFTPDGDEFNQHLVTYINGIDDFNFEMTIYNRWGQIVFQTKDKNVYWDGTYNGKLVQDGTYTWKIVVKDPYVDDRQEFVGHVNVLK
jgi:gliding motility-associated-like protein